MTTANAISSTPSGPPGAEQHAARREAMAVLAGSDAKELAALLAAAVELPATRICASPRAAC